MKYIIDIEADELLNKATRIHCLCYSSEDGKTIGSMTSYDEMRKFLSEKELVAIGHNFVRYDKPLLEKILEKKFDFKVIDTLPLSWVLYTQRDKHGLESWGEDLGVKKPKIESFVGISEEKLGIVNHFEYLYPDEKL